jgi:hypothetical protein
MAARKGGTKPVTVRTMQTRGGLRFRAALYIGLLISPLLLRANTAGVEEGAAVQNDAAAAFLQDVFGFTSQAVEDARNGTPAVSMLDSDDRREIGAVGLIGVRVAPARYVEHADTLNGLMALPNILTVLLSLPLLRRLPRVRRTPPRWQQAISRAVIGTGKIVTAASGTPQLCSAP